VFIGARYMIVNDLLSTLASCGVKPLPADLADLIHRSLEPFADGSSSRRDSSTSRTVYGVLCEGDSADGKKELTLTPQAFMGSTRSSAMARSSRAAADKTRNSSLLNPSHPQRVHRGLHTSNFL
jgi:hypothetical protein